MSTESNANTANDTFQFGENLFAWGVVKTPARIDKKTGKPVVSKSGKVSTDTAYPLPIVNDVGTFVAFATSYINAVVANNTKNSEAVPDAFKHLFGKEFKDAFTKTVDEEGNTDDEKILNELTTLGKQAVDWAALGAELDNELIYLQTFLPFPGEDAATVFDKANRRLAEVGDDDEFTRRLTAIMAKRAQFMKAREEHESKMQERTAKMQAAKAKKAAAKAAPAA